MWITRDAGEDTDVRIWDVKPVKTGLKDLEVWYSHHNSPLCEMWPFQFKAMFGHTPRKGSIKEVKRFKVEV